MSWYDHAEVYDVAFGWDPSAERDLLLRASARWGIPSPRRILEPFCGPARLLRALPGLRVGFDSNLHMVRRAVRRVRAFRGDATACALRPGSFDLAFSLVDSFRHLPTEQAARSHLESVARALETGAVYVLGFDLTGDLPADVSTDTWIRERGDLRVRCRVRGLGDADPDSRRETMHVLLEVERCGQRTRIEDFCAMRVWTCRQFENLVDEEGSFEIAAQFDRSCDLEYPIELSELHGSAIFVLKKVRAKPTP